MQHTIARDVICSVQGPGWSYGIARILIDSEGHGAVFVPPLGSGPVKEFTVTDANQHHGNGLTAEGGTVTWRRKPAGCGFKLARCHATTEELATHWG